MADGSETAWLVIGERSIMGIPSAWLGESFGLCSGSWMKAVSTSPMAVAMLISVLFLVSFTHHNVLFSCLHVQLTNEPHMSHAMINFDYKVSYLTISRLHHAMPHPSPSHVFACSFY